MKKRILLAVGVLVAIALGTWFVVRSRSQSATVYRLASVDRGNIQQTVSATGTLSAIRTVQVGTRVSGQVAELHADFNDKVTKGQLLARIDPTLQQQAVADAQAQLGKAQAQYDQAKAEYDRNQPLFAQKFISATEFATLQMNLAVGVAGLKSAQVSLGESQQNLAYTNIFAPISGIIVVRSVDVGQTVAASLSAPQLFLIAQDLTQIQILTAVDESDIAGIKDSQMVKFTVEAYPDTFNGRVGQVRLQSQLTDNVVNYTVVVKVENADGRLLPSMTATVQFITGSVTNVMLVPNLALRYKPSADQLATPPSPPTGTDTTRPDTSSAARGAVPAGARGAAGRGSGRGGGGAGRPPGSAAGGRGTVYVLDTSNKLKAIRVRIGLSDGQRTEVTSDSLAVGTKVVVGVATTTSAAAPAGTNPLTPQRGAGGGGRGGG